MKIANYLGLKVQPENDKSLGLELWKVTTFQELEASQKVKNTKNE